ncbi:NrtR DNA-binding winged helix domain-containing protein [Acetobacter sp. DsW_063]|uniref:NrtR DNA-binding winged helix domain-containing protein n=1 Tax=Acetobacter sp. DsW_063 TaxID=1514894 RepID=UPI000A39630D|nr:hypothetical protein [Acetobacter sp. DsW_063]OUJ13988.1 hypothetical protein HK28_00970 [Acetobacter sp. DsW_063]
MREGARIVLVAVPIALKGDVPYVMTGDDGFLPSVELGRGSVPEVLRDMMTRRRSSGVVRAEQLALEESPDGRSPATSLYVVTTTIEGDAANWSPCYHYLPWEDRRSRGDQVRSQAWEHEIEPGQKWVNPEILAAMLMETIDTPSYSVGQLYRRRIDALFGTGGWPWRPELAYERFMALREAVVEGRLDEDALHAQGVAGLGDRERHLARALGVVRNAFRSLSVPTELMPRRFTLRQLQAGVEGVMGEHRDSQMFRREITRTKLVASAGGLVSDALGRPSRLFRFRIEMETLRELQTMTLTPPVAIEQLQSETLDAVLAPQDEAGGHEKVQRENVKRR